MALAVVGIQVKVGGVQQATAQINALKGSVDALVASVKRLSTIKAPNIKNLNIVQPGGLAAINQQDQRIDQSTRTIFQFGQEAERTAKKATILGTAIRGVGAATSGILGGLGGITRQITAVGRSLVSFGSIITTLGFRLSVLAAPFVLGMGAAIKKAVEFEDSIVGLITRVRISAEGADIMREGILRLSQEIGSTPTDLAAAGYSIMSREIRDTNVALNILEQSSKASAIGLGDVQEIAAFVSSAFITMGAESGGVSGIVDTLVRAVQFGAIEADEFTQSLGRALGLAVNLGIGIAELTSFVGVFGIAGGDASEAVTGLVGVLRAIIKPSKQAQEAFARIFGTGEDLAAGVKAAQAALEELGLARFIKAVSDAAGALEIPLSTIFTRLRGLNAALFVSEAAWDEYQITLNAVGQSAGALEEAFAITQTTTGFQLDLLRANAEILAIVLGDTLLPAINTIVQAVIPLVIAIRDFVKLHPQIGLVAAAFTLIAIIVGPLVIIFGIFLSSIGTMISAIGILGTVLVSLLSPLNFLMAAVLALVALFAIAFLGNIPSAVKEGIAEVRTELDGIAEDFGEEMTSFADAAFVWGRNLIIQLAEGIAAGAIAVFNAIRGIGIAITEILRGSSPPKLLPDLPEWGANIVNELLRGFTLADFSIFDELSGTIASLFRALPEEVLSKEGAVGAILGNRTSIAAAIAQFRETGTIAQTTLNAIGGSFGAVSTDIQNYVGLMLEAGQATLAVVSVQEEITAINKRFDAALKPLNDRLGEIAEKFEAVKLAQEREGLQDILDDPRAPELAKELALLQLERLEIEGQVSSQESLKDSELELANARLEAAKEIEVIALDRLKLQKEIIDAQIEELSLVKSLEETLDSVAKKAKKASEELSSLAPGAFGGFDPGDPEEEGGILGQIAGALTETAGRIKTELETLFGEIVLIFEPVLKAFDDMKTAWEELFKVMEERDISTLDIVKSLLALWAVLRLVKAVGPVLLLTSTGKAFGFLARGMGKVLTAIGLGLGGSKVGLSGAFGTLITLLAGPVGVLALIAGFLVFKVAQKFDSWEAAAADLDLTIGALRGSWEILVDFIVTGAAATTVAISEWTTQSSADIGAWLTQADIDIHNFIVDSVVELVTAIEGIGTAFDGVAEAIGTFLDNAVEDLILAIIGVIGWLDRGAAAVGRFVGSLLGVKVPEDVAQDSPSPLEQSLMDIAAAFNVATVAAETFKTTLSPLVGLSPSQQLLGVGNTNSGGQFQIGPNNISNGMDEALFEARVRQIVAGAIG